MIYNPNSAPKVKSFIHSIKVKHLIIMLIISTIIISKRVSHMPSTLVLDLANSNVILNSIIQPYKHGIFLYSMSDPVESWWQFECIETKMRHTLNTHLCIHDVTHDGHVSGQLKAHGLWEPNNVRTFIKQMLESPEANVIDIGANIGLYTLIAAKHNRTVIAVEPMHDNVIRIHKAAHLENVHARVIALVNAIANERKAVSLVMLEGNYGGSYVIERDESASGASRGGFVMAQSTVIVNSIFMDDLCDVIEAKKVDARSKRFIVKMDIEGYEPYAFEKAHKLFQKYEIVAVFLEFGKMVEKLNKLDAVSRDDAKPEATANGTQREAVRFEYHTRFVSMLNMFKKMNYEPYEVNGYNKLEFDKWRHWPWDVYLRKCDLIFCDGHVYKVQGV